MSKCSLLPCPASGLGCHLPVSLCTCGPGSHLLVSTWSSRVFLEPALHLDPCVWNPMSFCFCLVPLYSPVQHRISLGTDKSLKSALLLYWRCCWGWSLRLKEAFSPAVKASFHCDPVTQGRKPASPACRLVLLFGNWEARLWLLKYRFHRGVQYIGL